VTLAALAACLAGGALATNGCAAILDYGDDPPLRSDVDAGAEAGPATTPRDGGGDGDNPTDDSTIPPNEELCEAELDRIAKSKRPSFGLASSQSASVFYEKIDAMRGATVRGAAVAVTLNGMLVVAKGYGFADVGTLLPVQPDSVFRLTDSSSPIVAAAIYRLVEAGKLSLDDKVFAILNVLPLPGETSNPALDAITIRHLLQHTAGWNEELTGDPMFDAKQIGSIARQGGPAGCPTILRYMRSRPLTWTPGTVVKYSNFTQCVLGAVIEAASGTTAEAFIRASVLAPAGAQGMMLGGTLASQRVEDEVTYFDGATAPSVFDDSLVPRPYGAYYFDAWGAGGSWVGSAVDVMRIQTAIDGRSLRVAPLLKPASIEAMVANPHALLGLSPTGTAPPDPNRWRGGGWWLESTESWYLRSGIWGVASVQVRAADGLGFTVMINGTAESELVDRMFNAVWNARAASNTWTDADLFDQFGPLSPWMRADAFQAHVDAEAKRGNYASRIDGRYVDGALAFRARTTPTHGWPVATVHNVDCITYRGKSAFYATQGYQAVSFQSFVDGTGVRRYQASWAKPQ
jgi:N-acyl-D-amino-acid deacylase